MNYSDFVAQKLTRQPPTGLADVPALHPTLFPHQRDLVGWSLRRGRAALFADTGLGKTAMQLEWARHVGGDVLVLAPLAVARQTAAEGARLGLNVTVCKDGADVRPGVNVTNYDRLHRFDASRFRGVVLDECFAEGTMVDTPTGPRPIESIRVGDEIVNAFGVDVVSDVHRREVPYGVRVSIHGRVCLASPNHPFFTQRGWVGARDLRRGDHVLETTAALPLVREGVRSAVADVAAQSVLRSILLSELADEYAGTQGEGAHARGRGKEGRGAVGMACIGRPESAARDCENQSAQPVHATGRATEDLPPIERDRPRSFRAWGQWSRADLAAIVAAGGAWVGLASGVCLVTGPTAHAGLPDALQDRLGQLLDVDGHRGGWFLPSRETCAGREEGREAAFARVDGIEILEPGHPELERLRSSDGKLYFFDLGGTRHPSFSVAGSLVHNSSIIKHHDAKTLRLLLDAFATTPFKLCATATPSPNDYTELGTHAEFLGVCTRTEMLSEFFCHDGGETQTWRLKGHARAAYWRWVSSWAALLRKPSDLGYDDDGYDLPPLTVAQHVLPADAETVRASGLLFAAPAGDLTERRNARRGSIGARVRECADLVNADSESWVVWCDLNAESESLTKAIPGAIEIRGSDDAEVKEQRLADFVEGRERVLVTKASIAGWGINMQRCARVAFVGMTDSYEAYYQAVRRCWRFGQKRPVDVHVFASEVEGSVLENLRRKEADATRMAEQLSAETRDAVRAEVRGATRETNAYAPTVRMKVPAWIRTEDAA